MNMAMTPRTAQETNIAAMPREVPTQRFTKAEALGGLAMVLIGVVLAVSSAYVDGDLLSLALCNAGIVLVPVGALLTLLAVR